MAKGVLPIAVLCAICLCLTRAAPGQVSNYSWTRTDQAHSSLARATFKIQDQPTVVATDGGDLRMDEEIVDAVNEAGSGEFSVTVPGGGGGGGGGAAGAGGGGGAGTNGAGDENASGGNGTDGGNSAVATGGKGGAAGGAGEVEGSGGVNGISSIGLDHQPSLSWTFIHNHEPTSLSVVAAGGGGGGGAGGNSAGFFGGAGGNGGNGWNDPQTGVAAVGGLMVEQFSGVNLTATLDFADGAPGNTPETTIAGVHIDVGWVSTDNGSWQRSLNMQITFGGAVVWVNGNPGNPITVTAVAADGYTYVETSVANLGSGATASYGFSPNVFWDFVSVGQSANISTYGQLSQSGVFSAIGAPNPYWANPGVGGGGGLPVAGGNGTNGNFFGPPIRTIPSDKGLGGDGGDGGTSSDGTIVGNGGRGGDGDALGFVEEHGIYQGLVEVVVIDSQ